MHAGHPELHVDDGPRRNILHRLQSALDYQRTWTEEYVVKRWLL